MPRAANARSAAPTSNANGISEVASGSSSWILVTTGASTGVRGFSVDKTGLATAGATGAGAEAGCVTGRVLGTSGEAGWTGFSGAGETGAEATAGVAGAGAEDGAEAGTGGFGGRTAAPGGLGGAGGTGAEGGVGGLSGPGDTGAPEPAGTGLGGNLRGGSLTGAPAGGVTGWGVDGVSLTDGGVWGKTDGVGGTSGLTGRDFDCQLTTPLERGRTQGNSLAVHDPGRLGGRLFGRGDRG
jgi:hypothetical protein